MKNFEVESFCSVEELMSRCTNSELRAGVSSVLRENKYIGWNLVSCAVDGDVCRSEFSAPINNSDLKHHLTCKITPQGEYRHYTLG